MTSRKWLVFFLVSIFLILALVGGFNILADPFGVFGDPIFDWYSYNMTQNPRAAKIAYLDENYENYDSYILGSSGASSLSAESLSEYMDARFYNLFVYGADMYDTRLMAEYIVENYNVENIVLNLGLVNAERYNAGKDGATNYLHANVDGAAKFPFYLKYAYTNPLYSITKIRSYLGDTYLPQKFDVFDEETGCYDKSARDVESIGALESYLSTYPEFEAYSSYSESLVYMDECLEAVAEIKDICDENNITFVVVIPPMYAAQVENYSLDEVLAFYTRLAEITDFWDFSVSSVSLDPRYFYDTTHYRNSVGEMMLARIFQNDSAYIPEDFGVYVTDENAAEQANVYAREMEASEKGYTAEVPILLYHHLAEESTNEMTVSQNIFASHMEALDQAGYTTISFDELISYVETGTALPDRPVIITFDDGYSSNYEIAFPILAQYGMKATIFAVGVSVGRDSYKDTGRSITPHFGAEEMTEMVRSGLISIQSHSYDMHQAENFDSPDTFRTGVLQRDGESQDVYMEAFYRDFDTSRSQLKAVTGESVLVYSYPYGLHSTLSEVMLREKGVKVTLSTETRGNTVIKGLPQSLRTLGRYTITEDISAEALLALLQ